MEHRTFDWKPRHDPRSLEYPIRTAVERPRYRSRMWRVPRALDQGREGACVGFAWTGEALTTPVAVKLNEMKQAGLLEPNQFAQSVYKHAQTIDEWDGEDYSGTSVLAGAKVMREKGLLHEYRWAFGVEDVKLAILTTGPVVLGINWYSGMYEAPGGELKIGGQWVGGHAILARGYRDGKFSLLNSWGEDWGIGGTAWISEADLSRLLSERGEACVPFRRSYGR